MYIYVHLPPLITSAVQILLLFFIPWPYLFLTKYTSIIYLRWKVRKYVHFTYGKENKDKMNWETT